MNRKVAVGLALLVAVVVSGLVYTTAGAARKSTLDVDRNLRQGVTSAIEWDRDCRNVLTRNLTNREEMRNDINYPCGSYGRETWLSAGRKPKAITPIDVGHGATSVNLQINSVIFVKGPLVNPDYKGEGGSNRYIDDWNSRDSRWVKDIANANDRPLNSLGGVQYPALFKSYSRIHSLSVISGGGSLEIQGSDRGFMIDRDNNSRYWFAGKTIPVVYNKPGGIKNGDEIVVRIRSQRVDGYPSGGRWVTQWRISDSDPARAGSDTKTQFDPELVKYAHIEYSDLKITFNVLYDWSLASKTRIDPKNNSTKIGETIGFEHMLENLGPTQTNKPINYSTHVVRVAAGSGSKPSLDQVVNATDKVQSKTNYSHISSGRARGPLVNWFGNEQTQHRIQQADVGKWLCAYITANPKDNSSDEAVRSYDCKYIPYEYNLVPSITNLPTSEVTDSGKGEIDVKGQVANDGPTKSRPDVQWQLTQVQYDSVSGSGIANATGGIGAAPCDFFVGSAACSEIGSGAEASGYGVASVGSGNAVNPDRSRIYSANGQVDDVPAGTRICYVMSVRPYNHSTDAWRHSSLHCLIVGKKPQVQVWGGGVQVGRTFDGAMNAGADIKGSLVTKSGGRTFGSWSEYGLLAPGMVRRVASGSGLNMVGGHLSSQQSAWSPFTFTQIDRANSLYGGYTAMGATLPDVTVAFPTTSAIKVPNLNIAERAKGQSIRPAGADGPLGCSANITTSGDKAALNAGEWLVINAAGCDVMIDKDIEYADGPFSNAGEIPQLIIIADNITIKSTVTRVDAWLVARNDPARAGAYGAVATCDEQTNGRGASWLSAFNGGRTNYANANAARLTVNECNQQLNINGPVIASQLYLRRTAGAEAGDGAGMPAEIINLRPDAYLWAREHTGLGLVFQSVSETQLPPRY